MLLSEAVDKFYKEYFSINSPIACIGCTEKEIVVYLKQKVKKGTYPLEYEGYTIIYRVSGKMVPL